MLLLENFAYVTQISSKSDIFEFFKGGSAPHSSLTGGPLEMSYTYPSSLGHGLSEYIWLWESISKSLGGVREQTNKQTDRQDYNFIILDIYMNERNPKIKERKKKKNNTVGTTHDKDGYLI